MEYFSVGKDLGAMQVGKKFFCWDVCRCQVDEIHSDFCKRCGRSFQGVVVPKGRFVTDLGPLAGVTLGYIILDYVCPLSAYVPVCKVLHSDIHSTMSCVIMCFFYAVFSVVYSFPLKFIWKY